MYRVRPLISLELDKDFLLPRGKAEGEWHVRAQTVVPAWGFVKLFRIEFSDVFAFLRWIRRTERVDRDVVRALVKVICFYDLFDVVLDFAQSYTHSNSLSMKT